MLDKLEVNLDLDLVKINHLDFNNCKGNLDNNNLKIKIQFLDKIKVKICSLVINQDSINQLKIKDYFNNNNLKHHKDYFHKQLEHSDKYLNSQPVFLINLKVNKIKQVEFSVKVAHYFQVD